MGFERVVRKSAGYRVPKQFFPGDHRKTSRCLKKEIIPRWFFCRIGRGRIPDTHRAVVRRRKVNRYRESKSLLFEFIGVGRSFFAPESCEKEARREPETGFEKVALMEK